MVLGRAPSSLVEEAESADSEVRGQEEAVAMVLKQAEALADTWTTDSK